MSAPASDSAAPAQLALQEHVPLAPYTTFGIGGPARWFAPITAEEQLPAACAWAAEQGLPIFILGGGSNLLVADAGFRGLVLHIALRGVESEATGLFRVAAGEGWDRFVDTAVAQNCAGIECLAGIPGTVGGTPVQNVGAYGQEVSQTITRVRCFDRQSGQFVEMNSDACAFFYRSSRFNTGADRGRFVVTRVDFQLRPAEEPNLAYSDLKQYFLNVPQLPKLQDVARAVREIRARKGMVIAETALADRDPDTRSAGSFFKNPVVPSTVYEAIACEFPSVPTYPAPDAPDGTAQRKLAAAWLLEQAGFAKGFALGRAAVSSKHTLALTNHSGDAKAADILALRDRLVDGVRERFGIVLVPEPIFLG
jgi:UDP-N-acetylmuramate dehydrogenase